MSSENEADSSPAIEQAPAPSSSPEELIALAKEAAAETEEPPSRSRSYSEYGESFQKARELARQAGAHELSEHYHWDLEACWWSTREVEEERGNGQGSSTRFQPANVFAGNPFPDPAAVTPEKASYWRHRATETKNPILIARYRDLAWEFWKDENGRRSVDDALGAIDAYLVSTELLGLVDNPHEWCDALERAAELAIMINRKDRLPEVVSLAIASFKIPLDSQGPYRHVWALRVVLDVREQVPEAVSDTDLERVDLRISEMIAAAESWKAFNLMRTCSEIRQRLMVSRGLAITSSEKAEELASLFEREGDFFNMAAERGVEESTPGSTMSFVIAAHHYEEAVKKYQEAGKQAKVDELSEKIRAAYGDWTRSVTPMEFTVPLNIDQEQGRRLAAYLSRPLGATDLVAALQLVASDPQLFPSLARARLSAEETRINHPVLYYLHHIKIQDDRRVSGPSNDGDREAERQRISEDQHFMWDLGMISSEILSPLLAHLKRRPDCTAEGIADFLVGSSVVDLDDRPFVVSGLAHWLKGDAISVIHILAPRLESVLRKLFRERGINTTKFLRDGTQEDRSLESLLRDSRAEEILGTDLLKYVRAVTVDKTGLAIRTRTAHGQLTAVEATPLSADLLVHLFLLLTTLKA